MKASEGPRDAGIVRYSMAGYGILLILRARFGMRVKNRSRKPEAKHERERDYTFLRGRDAGIMSNSMGVQYVRDFIFFMN